MRIYTYIQVNQESGNIVHMSVTPYRVYARFPPEYPSAHTAQPRAQRGPPRLGLGYTLYRMLYVRVTPRQKKFKYYASARGSEPNSSV